MTAGQYDRADLSVYLGDLEVFTPHCERGIPAHADGGQ